jgi:hypothetical protein
MNDIVRLAAGAGGAYLGYTKWPQHKIWGAIGGAFIAGWLMQTVFPPTGNISGRVSASKAAQSFWEDKRDPRGQPSYGDPSIGKPSYNFFQMPRRVNIDKWQYAKPPVIL